MPLAIVWFCNDTLKVQSYRLSSAVRPDLSQICLFETAIQGILRGPEDITKALNYRNLFLKSK